MKHFLCLALLFTSLHTYAEKIVFSSVPRVEMLFGINIMHDTVQIKVESKGCTTNDSFFVEKYKNSVDDLIHLNFIRVRPDWCKAYFSQGVWLQFKKTDLEILTNDIIMIDNPFGPF